MIDDDLLRHCTQTHRGDQAHACARNLSAKGNELLEMLGPTFRDPAATALSRKIARAVATFPWGCRPDSRHDRHDHNPPRSACAICSGDVGEIANVMTAVVLGVDYCGWVWVDGGWIDTCPHPGRIDT